MPALARDCARLAAGLPRLPRVGLTARVGRALGRGVVLRFGAAVLAAGLAGRLAGRLDVLGAFESSLVLVVYFFPFQSNVFFPALRAAAKAAPNFAITLS